MRSDKRIAVVIPAQNEADAIAKVIGDIPAWVDQIIVADNGSSDATAEHASNAGADVVYEPEPGYGAACLAGLAAVRTADIIVFLMVTTATTPMRWQCWSTQSRPVKPTW